MKKQVYILFGLVLMSATAALTSCGDFLDEDPKGNVSSLYAETQEGAEKQLLSLYQVNCSL